MRRNPVGVPLGGDFGVALDVDDLDGVPVALPAQDVGRHLPRRDVRVVHDDGDVGATESLDEVPEARLMSEPNLGGIEDVLALLVDEEVIRRHDGRGRKILLEVGALAATGDAPENDDLHDFILSDFMHRMGIEPINGAPANAIAIRLAAPRWRRLLPLANLLPVSVSRIVRFHDDA